MALSYDVRQFGPQLKREFYVRETRILARDLLGRVLVHRPCAGRIVETEAYLGGEDLASHAARGVTPRTQVIFGQPGRAYIYFIYGMHECLNVVAGPKGSAGCILIRALEPLAGIQHMQARRGKTRLRDLTSGPGKLTEAMAITRELNGTDLTRGPLSIRAGDECAFEVAVTPRIGISKCADWPLRYFIAGNEFVSR